MVGLYRDPKGDHIFESKRSSMANNTNNSLNNENANTVAELKRRIQELEMQAQQNMVCVFWLYILHPPNITAVFYFHFHSKRRHALDLLPLHPHHIMHKI